MRILNPVVLACLVLVAGCASEGFTDQELILSSRHVEVTIENRSGAPVAVLFTANTMQGHYRVMPGFTEQVLWDPAPVPAHRRDPRFPELETWTLLLGQAVAGPQGELAGVRGPFLNVAGAQEPFLAQVERLFLRVDSAGARLRRIGP